MGRKVVGGSIINVSRKCTGLNNSFKYEEGEKVTRWLHTLTNRPKLSILIHRTPCSEDVIMQHTNCNQGGHERTQTFQDWVARAQHVSMLCFRSAKFAFIAKLRQS